MKILSEDFKYEIVNGLMSINTPNDGIERIFLFYAKNHTPTPVGYSIENSSDRTVIVSTGNDHMGPGHEHGHAFVYNPIFTYTKGMGEKKSIKTWYFGASKIPSMCRVIEGPVSRKIDKYFMWHVKIGATPGTSDSRGPVIEIRYFRNSRNSNMAINDLEINWSNEEKKN